MPWIQTLDPALATGDLKQLYNRVAGSGGQVDHVLQIHSLRPHTLEGHMALYKAVLHHRGNQLPKWLLEALGVWVSRLNGCEYCDLHHSAGLRRLLEAEESEAEPVLDTLGHDDPGKPFSDAQQTALAYARRLTRAPDSVCEQDIATLREAGFSDGQILEINQVVAYFNYANRTVSGLGVDLEADGIGQSPGTSENPADWSHH